jgi:hypothetical protein
LKPELEAYTLRVKNWKNAPAKGTVEVTLPRFLRDKGWSVTPTEIPFDIGPGAQRDIGFAVDAGDSYTAAALNSAPRIDIVSLVDDEIVGGVTLVLSKEGTSNPMV